MVNELINLGTNLYLCGETNKPIIMKKSLNILLGVAIAALVVTSCCPCRKASNRNHLPLLTTEWQLVQMDGKNITSLFVADETPRLILGANGSFGGFAGCNSMGGEYRLTPSEAPSQRDIAGKISFGNIMSTKRYCPNDQVEMALFKTLSEVDAYTIEGSRLFLFDNGELKLIFEVKE